MSTFKNLEDKFGQFEAAKKRRIAAEKKEGTAREKLEDARQPVKEMIGIGCHHIRFPKVKITLGRIWLAFIAITIVSVILSIVWVPYFMAIIAIMFMTGVVVLLTRHICGTWDVG